VAALHDRICQAMGEGLRARYGIADDDAYDRMQDEHEAEIIEAGIVVFGLLYKNWLKEKSESWGQMA
jgi:hypothetical protein